MSDYFTIRWVENSVVMIDQRMLPHDIVYRTYSDYRQVAAAIRDMVIRGAPAIGAAAGFGLALAAIKSETKEIEQLRRDIRAAADVIMAARPTAVNLAWAVEKLLMKTEQSQNLSAHELRALILKEAKAIADDDILVNRQMGLNGASLVPDQANIIHHCNTGSLATVGYGTALGVIRAAHEQNKRIHVYVDETRPRLQGARLTAWELMQLGIPHTVIVDGASGHIMRTKGVDLCLVGCDRIAANGDVANKIGTYNLALAARAHNVPFYCVGPTTTIDLSTPSGDQIPIEERPFDEITHIEGRQITPAGVCVANPAFDVTPAEYISAIITERGIVHPPYLANLSAIMSM